MTFEEWWDDAHKKHKLEPGLSLQEIFSVCWKDAFEAGRQQPAYPNYGWLCPRCGRGNAPGMTTCLCIPTPPIEWTCS